MANLTFEDALKMMGVTEPEELQHALDLMGLDYDEFLAHFGVRGMKWGVRKNRGGSGSTTDETGQTKQATSSNTHAKGGSSSVKKVNIKELSDDELRRMINRMQMEQQLKQLTAAETKKGGSAINEILKTAGKQTAQQLATKAAMATALTLIGVAANKSSNPVVAQILSSTASAGKKK